MIDNPAERRVFEELPAGSVSGRTRAMLKIEDGCQNYCAYCIIPYARGPVRSLPLERVSAEAGRLNSEGYGEIVVTGIEIASYGKDLGQTTLLDAVRAVGTAAPDARIRLGSLEPRTITEDFVWGLRQLPNICDHFHLSLQSGCDATLARMKRKYTTEEFYSAVQLLRRNFPRCGLTADLIVGFPGETEEEFEKTMAFIRKCAFSSMHIFPYSVRPGTLAARLPGQVDKSAKQVRARRAAAAARDMAQEYRRSFIGSTLEVLFEREEDGVSIGHAENYLEVGAAGTELRNKRLKTRINVEKSGLLFGEITGTTI
jgi:threonylcarbamoyladenosine tRNA methylthiotransferase MtaB